MLLLVILTSVLCFSLSLFVALFQPIFMFFVAISAILCCRFKTMLLGMAWHGMLHGIALHYNTLPLYNIHNTPPPPSTPSLELSPLNSYSLPQTPQPIAHIFHPYLTFTPFPLEKVSWPRI